MRTKDKAEALQLVGVRNRPYKNAGHDLQLARTYLALAGASKGQRTWREVFDDIIASKVGNTKIRWETVAKDEAFESILDEVADSDEGGRLFQFVSDRYSD